MSPRRTATQAQETRSQIVDEAAAQASVEGLEGLTIGHLATWLGLSKAGVVGPFGSKEQLQLAVVRRGAEVFRQQVWDPVAELPAGRRRLVAACERWMEYLERCPFPGGCLMTTASVEWDARQGAIRDAVAGAQRLWLATLAADAEVAVRAGELPPGVDPRGLAFEIAGIAMSLNQAVQLFGDANGGRYARRALERLTAPA